MVLQGITWFANVIGVETGLDTAVLTILGSAFGVMFATMTTLMFVSIRSQHRESAHTRDLIERSNQEHRQANQETRDLIERSNQEHRQANQETRNLIERSNQETRKDFTRQLERATDMFTAQHNETQRTLAKIVDSLADTRERLARLEGVQHHNPETPPRPGTAGGGTPA